MKKYALLIYFSIMGVFNALAQQVDYLEYFIDTDPGYGNATSYPITAAQIINQLQIQYPVDNLQDGLHIMYVRSRDTNNRWSLVTSHPFMKITPTTPVINPTRNITEIEYFVDIDPGVGLATTVPFTQGQSINQLAVSIAMNSLSDGLHIVYFRAKDNLNQWSLITSHPFLKITPITPVVNPTRTITQVEYFVDIDPGIGQATSIPFSQGQNVNQLGVTINMNSLSDGLHIAYFRAKDNLNQWSLVTSHAFLKIPIANLPPIEVPRLAQIEYFIDQDPGYGQGTVLPLANVTSINKIILNIPLNNLENGNHKVYVRVKNENNQWSLVNVQSFIIADHSLLIDSSPMGYCRSTPFNLPFQAYGQFGSGNVFVAQLSQSDGSFSQPTVLGNLNSSSSGFISCVIPANIPLGNTYKIRVISSNPELINEVDIADFEVLELCPPPCQTSVILVSTADDFSTGNRIIEANSQNGSITATNKITGNSRITLKAGKSFTFNPGFTAEKGTVFNTAFGGCNN
jgi:hypothetical protein